jgi:lysozyme
MPYLDSHARTTKPTKNEMFQPAGRIPTLFGVFVGFVKDVKDVQKNGRLRVWIPELGSAPDNPDGWVIVNYCSPFAGATNVETSGKSAFEAFDKTQTSYGFWMIPPDINNQVLVMFINGDPSRGIWIGSLYNQFMNNMVPGMSSSTNNYQYPGKNIPVAEYNKWNSKVTDPDAATKPYEQTKFQGIGNQGLITDDQRGVTNTSARRESPSQVFGILTPGPAIDASASPEAIRRKGGSAFIMDDGDGHEYIQLATKTGAQIKLDETNGFIYVINRDGTGWIQIDEKGNIDLFGAANISLRSQADINFRADRNINIEAGQNIYLKAAMDTVQSTTDFTYDVNNDPTASKIPYFKYVGEGKGQGGNIVMQAWNNWHSTTYNTAYLSVIQNNMNIDIGNSFALTTVAGGQDYNSKMGIKFATQASVDIAATTNIRVNANGSISLSSQDDVTMCSKTKFSINGDTGVAISSANQIGVTGNTIFGDDVGIVGTLTVAGGSTLAGPVSTGGSAPVNPPIDPNSPDPALVAQTAIQAEIKPMVDKINILATWSTISNFPEWQPDQNYKANDIVTYKGIAYIAKNSVPFTQVFDITFWDIYVPPDKFKRNAEGVRTTVTRFPTYEPCPEHDNFKLSSITGYTPVKTEGDKTYEGSGAPGNDNATSPPPDTTPGANNTDVQPESSSNSVVSKDFNMPAYECQLKIHEGVKYQSYLDSRNLPTGGIGHLLRTNEISQYPVPSPLSEDQVTTWFNFDAPSSIKGIQDLLGIDTWGNLSDVRKRACADLCYNMGPTRLSKFTNFISAMKVGNYSVAGKALQDSKWYTQVGRRGPNIISMITQNIDPNGCDKKFPTT